MTFDLAYKSFLSTIREYGMQEQILRGVLVGFSGGADSMLLLHLLLRYQKESRFPLVAVHVHHGIRGENADRDAHFTEEICKSLGVEFCLLHTDVPALAESESIGIEEAARNARYSCFYNIIQSRNDISSIALGHNSTDNLETVIFHLMRGCGSGGLAGIPPVRENIIRPLIGLSREDIRSTLSSTVPHCRTPSTWQHNNPRRTRDDDGQVQDDNSQIQSCIRFLLRSAWRFCNDIQPQEVQILLRGYISGKALSLQDVSVT